VFNFVSAKLWWIVGCSVAAILPASAPAQESSPTLASPEEVNAPWDDLLSVLRKSPIRGEQQNQVPQNIEQPDGSHTREFQPTTVPAHKDQDQTGGVPAAGVAPTPLPERPRVLEKQSSEQPTQFTRPRRETTAQAPKYENHPRRERQVPSSASLSEVTAANTQTSRPKRKRTSEPGLPVAVVPEFPRSLLPSSATR
jgi:hypothetical protein